MLELLLTWLTHSTLALGVAALCSSIRVPAAVCDAVLRAAVIMPFVTSALMMLGIEPAGTSVTIASPLEFTAQVVPLAAASSKSSSLLLLAWLASAIVGVARWAAEHRALSLWLQTAQPAPAAIQQLAASIAHRAGQRRRMRFLSTPHATSPLAAGSNTVLLPDRALAMDEAQLRGILGHEIAHLSRRDPQWRSMMSMLIALLPFQPLLRMARRAQLHPAEPLCDSLSVQWGADPRQLARSLHDIAQWQQSVQPRYAAAMAASGSGLVPRVEHLIRGGHAARTGLRRLGCGVSAGLSLVFMHSVPAIQAGMPTILGDSAPRSHHRRGPGGPPGLPRLPEGLAGGNRERALHHSSRRGRGPRHDQGGHPAGASVGAVPAGAAGIAALSAP